MSSKASKKIKITPKNVSIRQKYSNKLKKKEKIKNKKDGKTKTIGGSTP
jgi:hypothetical protein